MWKLIEEIKNKFDVLCITKDCAPKNFAIHCWLQSYYLEVKY